MPTDPDIARLRLELERLTRERDEERSLLVFLASAYVAAKERFGEPGTGTWRRFPGIQGSRMIHAVERLARVTPLFSGIADPEALADRICGAAPGEVVTIAPPVDPANPPPRLDLQRRRMTRCQADDDGYCDWVHCPQELDGEKAKGRHCPLDRDEDEDG